MGRTATIDKSDVISARDTLQAAGKPHGIIAIRKHLGRGSPGLIGRLLSDVDGVELPRFSKKPGANKTLGASSTEKYLVDALTLRDKEINVLHQTVIKLEQRAATAEARYASIAAAMDAKEQEVVRQREMFDSWRADLLHDRALLASPADQLTITIAGPAPRPVVKTRSKTRGGEQLDLYESDQDPT